MLYITSILFISVLFTQTNYCSAENLTSNRSIYSIGDTLSIEDQSMLYPVCNGADGFLTGDDFSFSNLSGDNNGGDYKITLISMNATW